MLCSVCLQVTWLMSACWAATPSWHTVFLFARPAEHTRSMACPSFVLTYPCSTMLRANLLFRIWAVPGTRLLLPFIPFPFFQVQELLNCTITACMRSSVCHCNGCTLIKFLNNVHIVECSAAGSTKEQADTQSKGTSCYTAQPPHNTATESSAARRFHRRWFLWKPARRIGGIGWWRLDRRFRRCAVRRHCVGGIRPSIRIRRSPLRKPPGLGVVEADSEL